MLASTSGVNDVRVLRTICFLASTTCALAACDRHSAGSTPAATIDVPRTASDAGPAAADAGATTDSGTATASRHAPITRLSELVRLDPKVGTFFVEGEVYGPQSECSPCRDIDCASVMCTDRWTLSDPDVATKSHVKVRFSVSIPPTGARMRFRVRPSTRGVMPGVIPPSNGPDAPRPEGLVVECVETLTATTCE